MTALDFVIYSWLSVLMAMGFAVYDAITDERRQR